MKLCVQLVIFVLLCHSYQVSSCDSFKILDLTKLDPNWTCYASSSNQLFPCQDSFDGDLFTYWHPGYPGKDARLSININVDVVLNGIKVVQDIWETGYAKKIKVAVGERVEILTQNERKEFIWNGKVSGGQMRGKQVSIEILEVHGTMGAIREVQLIGCKGEPVVSVVQPAYNLDPRSFDLSFGLIIGCFIFLIISVVIVYFCVTKRKEIAEFLPTLPTRIKSCCCCSTDHENFACFNGKFKEGLNCNCLHCLESGSSSSSSSASVVSKSVKSVKSQAIDSSSVVSKARSTSRSVSGSRKSSKAPSVAARSISGSRKGSRPPTRPASRMSQGSRMTRKSVCSKCSRVTEKEIEQIEAMIH